MLKAPNRRIGDVLLQCGMVTPAQLDEAYALSQRDSVRIGEALICMGVLDRERLKWALGVQFELSYVDVGPETIDWDFLRELPLARLRELRLLPLSFAGGVVHAVVADPVSAQLDLVSEELFSGRRLVVQLADEDQILSLLDEAARRRQFGPGILASRSGFGDAPAWLDACIEELGREDGSPSLVIEPDRSRYRSFSVTFGDSETSEPPFDAAMVQAIQDIVPVRFNEEFPIPGGYAGFAPSIPAREGARGRAALRVTSLNGSLGRVLVFERVPSSPPVVRATSAFRVRARSVTRIKASLLRLCGTSFESHHDCVHAEGLVHQFAIPSAEMRSVIARRLVPLRPNGWMLWEATTAAEADFAPIARVPRLVIVQADLLEDTLEPIGDSDPARGAELRGAILRGPHG